MSLMMPSQGIGGTATKSYSMLPPTQTNSVFTNGKISTTSPGGSSGTVDIGNIDAGIGGTQVMGFGASNPAKSFVAPTPIPSSYTARPNATFQDNSMKQFTPPPLPPQASTQAVYSTGNDPMVDNSGGVSAPRSRGISSVDDYRARGLLANPMTAPQGYYRNGDQIPGSRPMALDPRQNALNPYWLGGNFSTGRGTGATMS